MFSFLQSDWGKLKAAAKNWLYLSDKVYHFRKDLLPEADVVELSKLRDELKTQMKSKDVNKLEYAVEAMEKHMEKVGGSYFPRSSWGENIEFFFVAFIVYLGFTSFFIKPFKIPTNSMWPTYYGMTAEVWKTEEDKPNIAVRAFRKASYWASRYEVEAPEDGELLIPYREGVEHVALPNYSVPGRRFGVLPKSIMPARMERFSFFVGDSLVEYDVPETFSMGQQVIRPLLFPEEPQFSVGFKKLIKDGKRVVRKEVVLTDERGYSQKRVLKCLRTGIYLKKGDPVLSFDILTGDQLFVDRMSYHFVKPKIGDGFVFRTGNIDRLMRGGADESFYIKRLVGTPGDVLAIRDGGLFVNDRPAEGSIAFEKNAKKEEPYRGYQEKGRFIDSKGKPVPEDSYAAFGDNSYNSLDGREWGYVPEKDVVGRPLVIYYPFAKRWGLTK